MKMRKGFTLVELLIVIVIIGILAAAMLLSSGSASDAAKAASAVSEMRALKAAIIMYASNIGNNETQLAAFDGTGNNDFVMVVSQDMEKPNKIIKNFTAKYNPIAGGGANKGKVVIETKAGGDYVSSGVQERLKKNTALDNEGTADDGKMIFPLARVN